LKFISPAGVRLIDLARVTEILPMLQIEAIGDKGAGCVGVINLRGEIVPLFTAAPGMTLDDTKFIIVCSGDSQPVGLIADEVLDVLSVEPEQVALRRISAERSMEIVKTGDELLPVMDPRDAIR
jgi:purine-binding chemotaxis protein CheW